jgi:peptidoglycan/LPS O-acetylase OafA/YrhL
MMQSKNRAHGLDTLRGCAVLAVLGYHYLNNTSVLRTPSLLFLQAASEHLFFGVDMFFVLSGFLIGASLMRTKGDANYFANYFAHRAFRILPLYYVWLGIFVLLIGLNAGLWNGGMPWLLDQSGGLSLVSFASFTQNFASAAHVSWGPAWLGITWTLAVEVHFYILAAIMIWLIPLRYVGVVSVAVIAAAVGLKQWGGELYSGHALMVITPARLDAPFVGMLCAWLWRFPALPALVAAKGGVLRNAAVALIILHYIAVDYEWVRYPISSLSINAFVFGIAVLAFAGPTSAVPNFAVRALRWCGVRCYAIYLFHVGVLGLVTGGMFNYSPNVFSPGKGWPAVILGAAITFILVDQSWRWFEKPLIDFASSLARRNTLLAQQASSII